MSNPIDDQRAAAERQAGELLDDYERFVRPTTDRIRRRDGELEEKSPAVRAMVADFQRRAQGGMLACPHLHERPIQPTFWVACEPDRLSCWPCAGVQAARLAREVLELCDSCGRMSHDLTQVNGVIGRFNLRGYFCERCHPTGL
jgi:hypothetical protein